MWAEILPRYLFAAHGEIDWGKKAQKEKKTLNRVEQVGCCHAAQTISRWFPAPSTYTIPAQPMGMYHRAVPSMYYVPSYVGADLSTSFISVVSLRQSSFAPAGSPTCKLGTWLQGWGLRDLNDTCGEKMWGETGFRVRNYRMSHVERGIFSGNLGILWVRYQDLSSPHPPPPPPRSLSS